MSIFSVWVVAVLVYMQKLTQQQLLRSEEALNLGWKGAGDGMWDWNIENNTLMLSDRFKELLGHQPDEIPSEFDEWVSRLHDDDREKALDALDKHVKKTRSL